MAPTAAPAPSAPARADSAANTDPRQLAADLERAVLPLPPAERRAVLARLVALAADPPANGHPGPPRPGWLSAEERERVADELTEVEARSPAFDPQQAGADWAWLTRELTRGRDGELGPHGGRHVAVYQGRVAGTDEVSGLRLRLRVAQAAQPPVHPNQLAVTYVDPWDGSGGW